MNGAPADGRLEHAPGCLTNQMAFRPLANGAVADAVWPGLTGIAIFMLMAHREKWAAALRSCQ
jgi:hypothetical protein